LIIQDARFLVMQINGMVSYNFFKSMLEYTAEEIQTGMSANFESAYELAYPLLKASGNGSIVNVSSVAGTVACWPGVMYGGMQGMVELLIIIISMFRFFKIFPFVCIYTWGEMGFQ
jgi:NAD(P)-dependent dehydrogenase (short-subunit alcohol dehydrogenase family)